MNYLPMPTPEQKLAQYQQQPVQVALPGTARLVTVKNPFAATPTGLDGAFNAACVRIKELEADLATSRARAAQLSVHIQQWQAENASLRAAYADLEAKHATPPVAATPEQPAPIIRAIRHSRQPIGLLTERPA